MNLDNAQDKFLRFLILQEIPINLFTLMFSLKRNKKTNMKNKNNSKVFLLR